MPRHDESAPPRRRRPRFWRRVAVAAVLVPAGAVVVTWVSVQRVPAWYQPARVPESRIQQVRDSLTAVVREMSDRLVAGHVFNIVLHDTEVTEWLATRRRIYPEAQAWIPSWLRDPVVAFRSGRVILAARLERRGWHTILGAHLSVTAGSESVSVRLQRATSGALPVPLATLARALADIDLLGNVQTETMPDILASFLNQARGRNLIDVLAHGFDHGNAWRWPNGERRFRVLEVIVADGTLTARIEPL